MADAEAEAAFLSSMQANNENTGGYNSVENDSGEQIESSDEYDPAQDVQDITLPDLQNQASVVEPSLTASHTAPSNSKPVSVPIPFSPSEQNAVEDPLHTASSMKSPVSTPNSVSIMSKIAAPAPTNSPRSAIAKARLPNDTIGILEDRIKEDEKGDIEAWLSLISEHNKRGKLEDVRKVYDRFFAIFPHAAEQWIALAQLENEANNRAGVEALFAKHLKEVPHLEFWRLYLTHIRRYFNVAVDKSTRASQTTHAAFDAVLNTVGIDKDAGSLWLDYIAFLKSSPGVLGQKDHESQSKMDNLRTAYQKAVSIPTSAVEAIWKDYSFFENSLNKVTGRQYLQKKSADYMSARSSFTELNNITRDLKRTTLPSLPPALGFDGDVDYAKQVEIWKRWIQWEKDDPLVLKDEKPDQGETRSPYQKRVLYVYKQAIFALRFWPELWYDAAEFCFSNNLEPEGDECLTQGIAANPESCLLAFKRADRLELTTSNGNDEASKQQRGLKVREPYDKLLEALYALIKKAMDREKRDLERIEVEFAASASATAAEVVNGVDKNSQDDDDDEDDKSKESVQDEKQMKINAVKAVNAVQITLLFRTISHAWIALMRAMQRMQGKGKVNTVIGGSRQIFTDARKRGRITSEVWVAAALLEFYNSDTEAAKRIFERGVRLFPDDEVFAIEYIKLLTNVNDHTNARVIFETTATKLTQKPETISKAKPLFVFFHQFESRYGELAQIQKLEARMKDLYPEDSKLYSFSQRFSIDKFDPTAIRPIISPAAQTRPKALSSVEEPAPPSIHHSPPVVNITAPPIVANSPKRPMPLDDFEADVGRPRKLARGESPIAGAAGRRLNQMRQNRQPNESTPTSAMNGAYVPPQPPPLPRDITFLLSIIPPASTYNTVPFKVDEMIKLIRDTPLPSSPPQQPPHQPPMARTPTVPGPAITPQYSHGAPNYYTGQPIYR